MHITAIIPARLRSQRLSQKLLIEVEEKPILQYVFERVRDSDLFDQVIIATDSKKIQGICKKFGAKTVLTSTSHKSGTDRIAELTRRLKTDIVVNVQGDEPLVSKMHLKKLIKLISKDTVDIATLCTKFDSNRALSDPSNVKLVFDKNKKALYFSRSIIPYPNLDAQFDNYYHHLGLYAFKRKTLLKLSRLKQSRLEQLEMLEQLRWLHNGFDIYVDEVKGKTISIDTKQDLKEFKSILKKRRVERKW